MTPAQRAVEHVWAGAIGQTGQRPPIVPGRLLLEQLRELVDEPLGPMQLPEDQLHRGTDRVMAFVARSVVTAPALLRASGRRLTAGSGPRGAVSRYAYILNGPEIAADTAVPANGADIAAHGRTEAAAAAGR